MNQKPKSNYEFAEHLPGDTLPSHPGWIVLGKSIWSRPGRALYLIARMEDGRWVEREVVG